MLVPSVSMAQSEEQAAPEESKQGAEEAQAQDSESKTGEPKKELKNGLLLGFSHAFRLIQDRGSATASESRNTEQLYGFLVGYERVLHRYLALSIIKPFYFNHERVDSPLEIVLLGIYRKNSWEPFLGAGIVSSLRSFETLRSTAEGKELEYAFGLHFVVGFKYFITPRWAVEFEFGYSFMPTSRIFEHEINDSYQGAYFF